LSLLSIGSSKVDDGEERQGINLPRRTIFIWAITILFFNQLLPVMESMQSASFVTLFNDVCAVGIFQYMAWYVILRLLGSSDPTITVRWRDLLVIAGLCVLLFLPTARSIWVAAGGIAIYLSIFSGRDPKVRAAAIVLAALSVQEFWGHVFFNLVAKPLLNVETAIVGTLLEAARPGTTWQENVITGPDGFGIIIYTGCSSFHNLSLAMLCWLTVSKFRNQNWHSRDLVIGSLIGGTVILLNVVRLFLMAWDIDLFRYWHEGIGAAIFGIGASITVLLISLYGSRVASS
jgi:exosortase/archaeosortase family protein